ncbi:MAG TPA: DUF4123 domain-containing protein [Modicisalibacter sp.]|nr:DUF4123 domain-containing protein [Modicisalibacter sp.]
MKSRFLVDLAMHRDGLGQMFEAEPIARHELLYLQTDQKSVADAGPLLIEPASTEAHATYQSWTEQGLSIKLQSTRSFDYVAAHLRTLTMVRRDQAPTALFRYADSRLYAGLQAVLGDSERARLLGPNEAMIGVAGNEPWALRQPPLDADHYALAEVPFRLTQEHVKSLQAWRQRAFLQPLADQHAIPIERLAGWFQQMIAMGFGNEQACFEGCQRLASLNIDQPISESHCKAIQILQVSWPAKLAALEARLVHARGTVQEARHD